MAPSLSSFLAELKRRKVYHVAVVYVLVGLAVAQGADWAFDLIELPNLASQLVAILLVLGFPIALVLAWAYEIRPEEPRKARNDTEEAADSSKAADRKSVVVLPFDNMSPDPGDSYFADGLTEEIITNLSRLKSLRVISRSSAMVLKGTERDVRTIGRELNVEYVLEGSVRKAGNDLRITAQLIDAASDEHIWAERYDGVLDDVFRIQEEVSRSIVDALELQLLPEEDRRLTERPIENVQAYECYLRARAHLWLLSEQSSDRALDLIQRGLEVAGDSDLLYAAKGHILFSHVDQMNRPPGEYAGLLAEAQACAARALEINPDSAQAYALLGYISQMKGDPKGALRHFGSALKLDPNNPDAHLLSGYWRAAGGADLEGARGFLERLGEIDPLGSGSKGAMGWLHWFNGDFSAVVDGWGDWQRELEGARSPYRILFAYFHAADGNVQEAVRLVDRVKGDSPTHALTSLAILLRHGWLGEREETSDTVSAETEEALWWDDIWTLLMAVGFALTGQQERAFQWLDHAVDLGISNVDYLKQHDPFFQELRSDGRFIPLLEKASRLSNSLLESLTAPDAG